MWRKPQDRCHSEDDFCLPRPRYGTEVAKAGGEVTNLWSFPPLPCNTLARLVPCVFPLPSPPCLSQVQTECVNNYSWLDGHSFLLKTAGSPKPLATSRQREWVTVGVGDAFSLAPKSHQTYFGYSQMSRVGSAGLDEWLPLHPTRSGPGEEESCSAVHSGVHQGLGNPELQAWTGAGPNSTVPALP